MLAVYVVLFVGLVIVPVPSLTKTARFVPLPLVQPMVIRVASTLEKIIEDAWVITVMVPVAVPPPQPPVNGML